MRHDGSALVGAARASVSFRLAGGAQPLLLLPVGVNGRGPYEFVLDTGASTTLLAPELASSLGERSTGTGQGQTAGGAVDVALATVESLGIGALWRANIRVAILDLSRISQTVGASLDGDLGYNFLKDFRLTIDFRACNLSLEDFGPPPLVEVPIRLAHPAKPLILLEVHLNEGGPFQFAVDTGTSTTTIAARLVGELALRTRPIGNVTTSGATISMAASQIETLRIGPAAAQQLDVVVGEFLEMLTGVVGKRLDGIFGYNFLRNFRVTIDYPGERFSLFCA